MQALRKEPEWRYQTAADLRDDITRFLEGRPISDLPDPPHAGMIARPELSNENSLAVLPMKLMDINQPDNPDYLGTGLADALITRLSAIRSFAVRPTSSVLRYGADADPCAPGASSESRLYWTAESGAPQNVFASRSSYSTCATRPRRGPDNLTSSLPTF